MKLVIISSNNLRHKFFINSLIKEFDVVGVITETKKRDPSKKGEGTELENSVKKYFENREKSEINFFGENEKIIQSNNIELIKVPAGEINNQQIIKKLKIWNPDYLVVFGSSILKDGIINLFPKRIINMHLGLSPYYRGSGTNFWPLYDEKLEYIGVTIHYLDKGIDSGEIIEQGRPNIEIGDTPHSIGNKTIKIGIELMIKILKLIENKKQIIGYKQDLSLGRVCLFKDCEAEHIIELEKKIESGLVEKYISRPKDDFKLISNLN